MIKIFNSAVFWRAVCAIVLLLASGCVTTRDSEMDFDIEINVEDCGSSFGDKTAFLVVGKQALSLSDMNGYALYHDILSEHGIKAYVIPKQLCEDSKYSSLLRGLAIVYPDIGQSQTSLNNVDLSEFKKSVFPQILKFMASRGRDGRIKEGVDDCGFELHSMASSRSEIDIAHMNAALEDALEGTLLYQRFPNLGRVFERIDYRESGRFSNIRGGRPFSAYADEISEIEYSFFNQDGRRFGSVRIALPWNYYVDGNIGSGLKDVQKLAMREFIRLLCDDGQRRLKHKGVIRRNAASENCKIIWKDE